MIIGDKKKAGKEEEKKEDSMTSKLINIAVKEKVKDFLEHDDEKDSKQR